MCEERHLQRLRHTHIIWGYCIITQNLVPFKLIELLGVHYYDYNNQLNAHGPIISMTILIFGRRLYHLEPPFPRQVLKPTGLFSRGFCNDLINLYITPISNRQKHAGVKPVSRIHHHLKESSTSPSSSSMQRLLTTYASSRTRLNHARIGSSIISSIYCPWKSCNYPRPFSTRSRSGSSSPRRVSKDKRALDLDPCEFGPPHTW